MLFQFLGYPSALNLTEWPSLLEAMYWLAQLLKRTETLRSEVLDDTFKSICFESYNRIGNDDVVQEKMKETRKLEKENTEKYKLNSRRDMLSDIFGVDFEATLKLKLLASVEDVDRALCQRQEELETLQQKLHEKRLENKKKKEKRKENKDLLARIIKLQTDHTTVEESMNKYISSKKIEYKKVNNNENEAKAEECSKKFKSELEEVNKQYMEKIEASSNELLQIALDEFAKYKEDMESLLS